MSIFNKLGIRFREQYTHTEKPDILLEKFKTRRKEVSKSLIIQMAYQSVFLKIPDDAHKWWSPELTINIEDHPKGSNIKEVTGPNPGTFTLAMFVIISALVILFFALMFAFSQIQLGSSPIISFLVISGSALVTFLVILILGWGRKKAHGQKEMMKTFVRAVISDEAGTYKK